MAQGGDTQATAKHTLYYFKLGWEASKGQCYYSDQRIIEVPAATTRKAIRKLIKMPTLPAGLPAAGLPGTIVTTGTKKDGERSLDIKITQNTGELVFVFQLPERGPAPLMGDADHGHKFDLRFFESGPISKVRTLPKLSTFPLKKARTYNKRKWASFVVDLDAICQSELYHCATDVAYPNSTPSPTEKYVLDIPFGFDLIDDEHGMSAWSLPRDISVQLVHGGPHPPTTTFITIPLDA